MEAQLFYQKQIELYQIALSKQDKVFHQWSFLRLVAFLSGATLLFFYHQNSSQVALIVVISLAVYLFFLSKFTDAKRERLKLKCLIQMNELEIKALHGDWSAFPSGDEFIDKNHAFSSDLDMFGERSLFQYLNRSKSEKAKRIFAEILLNGDKNKDFTSEMIEELLNHKEWSQQYLAESHLIPLDQIALKDIALFPIKKYWEVNSLRYLLPFIAISSTIAYNFSLINGLVLTLIYLGILSIVGRKLKVSNSLFTKISIYEEAVNRASKQMQLIDQLNFKNETLKVWKENTFGENGELTKTLKDLYFIQKRLSFRNNVLVGVLLNLFLAWDFQMLFQWNLWSEKNAQKIKDLDHLLSMFEVWISGEIYHQNQRIVCFAENSAHFDIQSLGHPHISSDKQVYNDFILANEKIQIITGPNMAGKSTYLRSVAWAIVSANAGFPVIAVSAKIPTIKLYTSMRSADDLSSQSSFFFAELSRLRKIVDVLEAGENVFVILDEILKGTNSVDKEKGSIAFLKKLNKLNAKGIIATHDLELCKLSDVDSSFKNKYFDSQIKDEELSFDYQINDGICKNMNATFLLRKMNLIDV